MDRDYIQNEISNIASPQELLLLEPAGLYASLLPLLTHSRCIRVIDISHNGDRNAPLRGSLRVVNLKDSPQFRALSYVWGDCSGNEYTLHCNGCDIPITKNCRDAIASLRSQHADLTIWIDAVCINQGDEKEKTSQIQMMEEIYTWAQAAFVWSLASFGARRALSDLWTLTYRPNCWNDKEIRQLPRGLMSRQSSSVRDYQERISMPRAWHYTKIVMITITFVMILTFTAYLVAITVATRVLFGALAMLYATRTEPHFYSDEYASGMPLAGLVRALRERRATVAKDKAFALHGVLHGLNISHTKADYDMSLGEVYRRLFLDLLRFKPATINLLVDVGPASLPGVPSWVPDWSATQDRPWLKAESVRHAWTLECVEMHGELLRAISAADRRRREPPRDVATVWRWVSIMTGSASRNLAIRDVISACVPDAQQAHISALGRCLEAASRETDGRQRSGGIFRGALERLEREDPEILGLAAECHRRVVDSNGRLFVSRSGLVGFGPPRTAEGDTIALLRGVAVPMVLRRAEGASEGDRYTVVGPAYVSGLMDLTEFNTSVHGADWTAVYLV
ncbi:heterokaryon incompatibility [Colletotrichum plurivorum]|uniref:Heterokaryon incompatibility n=1 Tax=Colletotrichum plurivorum TaxID=2175906 RepID=A0A8H6N0S1_9PEZI|nr:heterokaryon incompatibility [Colletotrichum plurivorum]